MTTTETPTPPCRFSRSWQDSRPETVSQPWGTEYACCGGEAGSGQHIGRCGA
jgi:hypothetical protein